MTHVQKLRGDRQTEYRQNTFNLSNERVQRGSENFYNRSFFITPKSTGCMKTGGFSLFLGSVAMALIINKFEFKLSRH